MPTHETNRLKRALALLRPRDLALRICRCPFCGPSVLVRLRRDETGVRCLRCGASAVHFAIGQALRGNAADLASTDACELSARGPLANFLRRHARSVALSEFFPDLPSGAQCDGVICQDVQRLSYADASFDLLTHTEVLEHVPDDAAAFAELRRVLRPDGLMLFTVPLHEAPTVERARLSQGRIEHLQPPIYHGDPLRAGAAVLAFRDYGRDIVQRLQNAGFARAWIEEARVDAPFGFGRPVVCARR